MAITKVSKTFIQGSNPCSPAKTRSALIAGLFFYDRLSNNMELLYWDIYEISSSAPLQGVMLRGRLRKFANQHGENLLVENDEDGKVVRFALLTGSDSSPMKTYIASVVPDAQIERVREAIPNPVLSKIKVNSDERYSV